MQYQTILDELNRLAEPEKVLFKHKKYNIVAHNALGVYQKDLKEIAKKIGYNNALAIQLFDSGIYEARILCSKLFNPKNLTKELMEKWVQTFENWEICDSFCMGLFAKSEHAYEKALEWSHREAEFEKRAGFAIMAAYCMADKKADNKTFDAFLEHITAEASDDRQYVKKAVNWALRNIGKRNKDLNRKAISTAEEIKKQGTKPAIWIANDALKELQSEKLNILEYPRHIYRN